MLVRLICKYAKQYKFNKYTLDAKTTPTAIMLNIFMARSDTLPIFVA